MITSALYIIFLVAIGFVNLAFSGIDALIPASVGTSLDSAVATIGTKIGLVYHLIPGADALWNILLTILVVCSVYLGIRIGVFIFNEIRGSGGAV